LSVQLRHKHFEHLLQNHYLWSSREEILLFRGIQNPRRWTEGTLDNGDLECGSEEIEKFKNVMM
jgi:hypothetical protein